MIIIRSIYSTQLITEHKYEIREDMSVFELPYIIMAAQRMVKLAKKLYHKVSKFSTLLKQ